MNYRHYDEKYANLLLKKCFVNNGRKPLVIVFDGNELETFAETCYIQALKLGFKDVNIFNKKSEEINLYAKNTKLENIKYNKLLDRTILEDYAKEESNFLFLETFKKETDVIDEEKSKKIRNIINEQLKNYIEFTGNLRCPWCVACYPNNDWAKKVYPDLLLEQAYNKLYLNILKMCQVDKHSPEKEWDKIHSRYYEISQKLNDLEIKKLHYSNNLGTNLDIYLPDNHLWIGADDRDYYGNSIMLNMPGYEIFTSPIYDKTEGVVYSSKSLYYKKIIDSFGLEFNEGKVNKIITPNDEDYTILKNIINIDEGSKYLGECALVENDTPVNQTNTLYYELLYDENASCHLALGNAYADSIKDGLLMSDEELKSNGLNISDAHVDFMIGTDDLKIEADTKNGKKLIYSNGKFNI